MQSCKKCSAVLLAKFHVFNPYTIPILSSLINCFVFSFFPSFSILITFILSSRTCSCFAQLPVEAAHLYHAVVQYVYALNRTLAKNFEPNGINIINALKKHTFDSKY
jgi:hypothetical protein